MACLTAPQRSLMPRYVAIWRLSWAALLLLALLVGLPLPLRGAHAQAVPVPAPAAADRPATTDLNGLLATLRDPQARTRLEQQIEALIAVQKGEPAPDAELEKGIEEGSPLLRRLSDQLASVGAQFGSLTSRMAGIASTGDWFLEQVERPERRAFWTVLAAQLAVVVLAAALAWFLVGYALRRPRAMMETRRGATFWVRVPLWLVRTVLDLLPIAAFAAGAYGALALVEPQRQVRLVALAMTNAVVLSWLIVVVARAVLTPFAPGLRLFPLSDATAAYLYVWVRRVANVAVFGFFLAQALLFLGLPPAGFVAVTKIVGLLVTLLLIVIVLQNRAAVRDWLQQRGEGLQNATGAGWRMLRNRLADVWHILAILYLGAAYVIWALEIQGGFTLVMRGTLQMAVTFAVAGLLLLLVRRGTERLFRVSDDMKARYPGIETRANRYLFVLRRLLEIIVYLVAAIAILQGWGIDILNLFATPVGRGLIARVVSVVLIVLISLFAWEIASAGIDRLLRDDGRSRFARTARGRTLLPLARNVLLVVISTMAVLAVLSELGVNIAPLLAGAGVIGLAIGFGAQTLVKDIITGAFILFEDTISVGDVVSVGGKTGAVEAISIRSIRLRDLQGTLHTIPFSSVDVVTNLTKDFAYFVADMGVAYNVNTDKVVEVMTAVAEGLIADKNYSHDVLAPFEVIGVDRFDESAIIVRGRIKTRPGQQWRIGREFNRRIKARFDQEGIEIPFRNTTVHFSGDALAGGIPVRWVAPEKDEKDPAVASGETAAPARQPPLPDPARPVPPAQGESP